MKLPTIDELRPGIEARSDAELLRMVSIEAGDYRDDVLEIARAELRRRGKEPLSAEEFLETRTSKELRQGDLFCRACLDATTDHRFAAVPRGQLLPGHEECPTCGSLIRDYYIVIFWIPLFHVASYRVKQRKVPQLAEPRIRNIRRLRDGS